MIILIVKVTKVPKVTAITWMIKMIIAISVSDHTALKKSYPM